MQSICLDDTIIKRLALACIIQAAIDAGSDDPAALSWFESTGREWLQALDIRFNPEWVDKIKAGKLDKQPEESLYPLRPRQLHGECDNQETIDLSLIEVQTLIALSSGMTPQQFADQEKISTITVRWRCKQALKKLNARTLLQAAYKALMFGLFTFEDISQLSRQNPPPNPTRRARERLIDG